MNFLRNTAKKYIAEIYNHQDEKKFLDTKSGYFTDPNEAFQWALSLKKDDTNRILLFTKDGAVFIL
ncbi:MAG: hypothetical protein SPK70_09155 [Succinivibrio dextrinosolvens]|nr:hypothetical protein [Succinivibrio dextrinosolvens]